MKRVVLAVLLCASCGAPAAPSQPAQVPVTGTFMGYGGPSPGVSVPLRGGVIHLVPVSGRSVDAAVDSTGRFETRVPPGRYTATGQAGVSTCTVPQTFVAAHKPIELQLGCAIP